MSLSLNTSPSRAAALSRHEQPDHALNPVCERLLAPAAQLGHRLGVIGVSPPPAGQLLTRAADGSSWVLSDFRADPSFDEHRGVVMPRELATWLTDLRAAGANWDRTLVAHELGADWTPSQPLPRVVPDARAPGIRGAERAADAGGALLAATARAASRVALSSVKAGARGAVAGASSLAFAVAEAIVLDPVLVAGIELPGGPLVAWVELARWSW